MWTHCVSVVIDYVDTLCQRSCWLCSVVIDFADSPHSHWLAVTQYLHSQQQCGQSVNYFIFEEKKLLIKVQFILNSVNKMHVHLDNMYALDNNYADLTPNTWLFTLRTVRKLQVCYCPRKEMLTPWRSSAEWVYFWHWRILYKLLHRFMIPNVGGFLVYISTIAYKL